MLMQDADASRDKNGLNLSKDRIGHKGRNRGRGRRQKYHGTNGHGNLSSQLSPQYLSL